MSKAPKTWGNVSWLRRKVLARLSWALNTLLWIMSFMRLSCTLRGILAASASIERSNEMSYVAQVTAWGLYYYAVWVFVDVLRVLYQ